EVHVPGDLGRRVRRGTVTDGGAALHVEERGAVAVGRPAAARSRTTAARPWTTASGSWTTAARATARGRNRGRVEEALGVFELGSARTRSLSEGSYQSDDKCGERDAAAPRGLGPGAARKVKAHGCSLA